MEHHHPMSLRYFRVAVAYKYRRRPKCPATHESIDLDIAAFLARGGHIDTFAQGATGEKDITKHSRLSRTRG